MIDLSIIIPCYNERDNLNILLKKLDQLLKKSIHNIEIILVDNGSEDYSYEYVKQNAIYNDKNFKVLRIEKNIGYGNGIMQGVYSATGNIVSWCHADLQIDVFETYNAFKKFESGLKNNKIIVKGKRVNRSLIDSICTFFMSILSSLYFQKILSDINAQPKIFNRSLINKIDGYPNDFSLDLFFLIMVKINKIRIMTHPVIIYKRYAGEAKGGGTLKGKIKLIIRTLKYMISLKKKLNGNNHSQN